MIEEDILDLIEIRASHRDGVTIHLTRNSDGGPYWSIRDSEISAGGYKTMYQAFEAWADSIKYIREHNL